MNSPSWPEIVLGIWAVLGPTAGVWFGQYLAKIWQQDQWLAENRKQEYRELISALTSSFATSVQYGTPGIAVGPAEQRERSTAEQVALETLRSRLYIQEEIAKLNTWTPPCQYL